MAEKIKEIWIRFRSQSEYRDNETELFSLLDTAPGDCIVKIYDMRTRGVKTLSDRSFDEKHISLLMDFFGEDNVKYQETEAKTQQLKPLKVPNIVQIIPCSHDMYAVFDNNGEKYKSKVLMYALCDNGEVYPLHFDNWLGICPLVDAVYEVGGYELECGEVWEDVKKPDEQK